MSLSGLFLFESTSFARHMQIGGTGTVLLHSKHSDFDPSLHSPQSSIVNASLGALVYRMVVMVQTVPTVA